MLKFKNDFFHFQYRLKYFLYTLFLKLKFSNCKHSYYLCNTDQQRKMNIITKRTVLYYMERYPAAQTALLSWFREFGLTGFNNFNELKQVYGNSSLLGGHRVIFNIKGNDFRLIVSVNFKAQAAYIIWFGTHQEYDQINASAIKHIEI